ncbi:putative RNA methyltransferase [Paenibacillus bouchesdurhonensis]|uniref:putative RNA methyltransferase n=1 Tax=Paenibacillus bouchesdurhonensis TaxID=1870990 RepID=UPI001F40BDF1|nr:methyltransferase domain-containing protein [Paenibacillus bouchesdurhonensis]
MSKFYNIPAGMVICPVCFESLNLQGSSLICSNSHCFDVAKQGYVNFLLQAPKEKYDKRLFQSRGYISQAGVFQGLTDRLSALVLQALAQRSPEAGQRYMVKLLDAGCGEGSHLSAVERKLAGATGNRLSLVAAGIDIAKEGIKMAVKRNPEVMWGVADLAKCPFADRSFDFILNILSPANYAEFQRMLAPEGLVFKVIPGEEYLQEIRQVLYRGTDRRIYSNDRTIALFRRHFKLVAMERVKYEVVLDQEHFMHLLQMTPLAWQLSWEQVQQMVKVSKGRPVTFDFDILTGKRKLN